MQHDNVLIEAKFDPRLKTYTLVAGALLMLLPVFSIVLIPLWLLGIGQYFAGKQFDALECRLTERSLNFSRGIIFRVQKNVPLDKITDLGVLEGPLLRRFGLVRLSVETAGQSSGSSALLSLIGIENALAFRDAVLEQRDLVTSATSSAPPEENSVSLLTDIRDSLHRIERHLEKGSS